MKNLVIVVDKNHGAFLGHYEEAAIFSKNTLFISTKAYGFDNQKDAEKYVTQFMPEIKNTVDYIEIPCDNTNPYVDIVDIIKAGHGDSVPEMFANLPTPEIMH